jgi:hypothetical protein
MNEAIPTGRQEPESKQNPNSQKKEPEKIILENSPLKVLVNAGKINWGSITEYIMIMVTIILAIYAFETAQYASNQAQSAIKAVNVADSEFTYQRWRDSISSRREHDRDSTQAVKDSLYGDSQIKRDSLNKISIIVNNRAFLIVSNVELSGIYGDTLFTFNISVKNVGKSPAYEVRTFKIRMSYGKMFTNENEIGQIDSTQSQVIGAGDIYIPPLQTTNERIIGIKKEDVQICLLGKVTYKDIFGFLHYTQFCGWVDGGLGGNFYPYGNLNKAN